MEKFQKWRKKLYNVFVDLEKAMNSAKIGNAVLFTKVVRVVVCKGGARNV